VERPFNFILGMNYNIIGTLITVTPMLYFLICDHPHSTFPTRARLSRYQALNSV